MSYLNMVEMTSQEVFASHSPLLLQLSGLIITIACMYWWRMHVVGTLPITFEKPKVQARNPTSSHRTFLDSAEAFFKGVHHSASVFLATYRWGSVWKDARTSHRYHVLDEPTHIQQLGDDPALSQRAVYGDMFGFKYSLARLDHDEQKTARTRTFGRVLHEQKSRLADLFPLIQDRLDTELPRLLSNGRQLDHRTSMVALAPTLRRLAGSLMCDLLIGPTLASEAPLKEALLQHPRDMINFAKAYQVVPDCLGSQVFDLVTKRGRALAYIMQRLLPVCGREPGSWKASEHEKSLTMLGGMLEATKDQPYWTPHRIVQALVGIWFASSHQPWTMATFITVELCQRPEYLAAIREEIFKAGELDYESLESLPLLNSFIKETVRFKPSDYLTTRRKVMRPVTFKNGGPTLQPGEIACISMYRKMTNSERYTNAQEFDGFRFAKAAPGDVSAKFTEVSPHFLAWGSGSLACPGRFQASLVVKMILRSIILQYDVQLKVPEMPTWWQWNTFRVPYESTKVLFSDVGAEQVADVDCE